MKIPSIEKLISELGLTIEGIGPCANEENRALKFGFGMSPEAP
jgi:hypothetical protein